MLPTVSIIVPVYNAQNTLRRCIGSILSQTYPHFELLLVDDGSQDDSGAICDEYAEKDNRIKVFHNENSGVSSSRNFALDHAQGEYIQFLDSDDWITPDATQKLVRSAVEYNCDLVISNFYRVVDDRVSVKGDIEDEGILTREEFAAYMMESPADFYYGVLWNKLYRRTIIESHKLRMNQEISWCEDFLFNLEYIRYANWFYALNIPLYYYVKTKGSLVSQSLSISATIQMKLTVFEYYNQLYKDILDEEEYQKSKLKVYRFFLDAASDGIVPPTILPSVQKLGKERVQVGQDMLEEEGVMADAYRERKLLERCLESAAIQHDLTLKEALVLLALGRDGFSGKRKDLAELANVSRGALSRILSQLSSRGFIQVKRTAVAVHPEAEETLCALERTIQDWKALRFINFTPDEIQQYKVLSRRVHQNVRRALK